MSLYNRLKREVRRRAQGRPLTPVAVGRHGKRVLRNWPGGLESYVEHRRSVHVAKSTAFRGAV